MPNKPRLIGITGGIGTGKSLICRMFACLGVPVYDADSRAKALVNESAQLQGSIMQLLGKEAYTDGQYNRSYVAREVFGNPEKLSQLNALIHPAVAEDFASWVEKHQEAPYLLKEAALLIESGSYKGLDTVVLVEAPEKVRIERVLMRDPQRSLQEVKDIMSRQIPEAEKRKWAQARIQNGADSLLIPQILALHEQFSQVS
ncbi:dephospho-CoA kinase [Cytophagales bacterium LB-30]|uniref:Dephospho-CoA kinase n=1 Tax=Shiella aurantiaca TaxID=3058365 RepID=A0ABT8F6X3_9BACT|nr:dephospho-CoA kinase [Shiella aurantiaca]MDN4165989.1 dephospho-CoA kinase [Shiella aurantiaca]